MRDRGRPNSAVRLAFTDCTRAHSLITLGILGGLAHILLTESYRYAASVVAPFDYSSLLWALLLGYWLFGELPDTLVYLGAGIVTAAGLFVIWRERQLGVQRALEAEAT